jgi:hypothetical protein
LILHPYNTPWEGIHNNTSVGEEDDSSTRREDIAKYHPKEKGDHHEETKIIYVQKCIPNTQLSWWWRKDTRTSWEEVDLIDDDLVDGWWRTRP